MLTPGQLQAPLSSLSKKAADTGPSVARGGLSGALGSGGQGEQLGSGETRAVFSALSAVSIATVCVAVVKFCTSENNCTCADKAFDHV